MKEIDILFNLFKFVLLLNCLTSIIYLFFNKVPVSYEKIIIIALLDIFCKHFHCTFFQYRNIPLLISGYWQIPNLAQNANGLLRKIKGACILLAHHLVNLSSAGNFVP